MNVGVVDSTVIIHLFRKLPAARAWLNAQTVRHKVTPITWLEVMHGAPGKAGQITCKAILSYFDIEYPTPAGMDWAMEQMERLRLSHGIGINDCLIASVSYRLQIPIYTHNLKDMRNLLGATLPVKPY